MRIQISGSKSHRVWKCPASAVLPQVDTDEQSPYASRGKIIHRFLERCRIDEKEAALLEAPEEMRPFLELLDIDELPTHVATEVTFAWDWRHRKGREIGRNLDRQYIIPGFLEGLGIEPLSATEHFVTVDVFGGEKRDGIYLGLVGDYKTGHTRYPSPEKFAQTMLGAVAARSAHRFDEMILDVYYIDEKAENYRARRRVDEWDLDAFEESWANAMELVDSYEQLTLTGQTPNVVEGVHCQHCNATKSCPAKVGLVSRLPVAIDDVRTGTMTRARAASAWLVLEQMGDLIKLMKEEIRGMAFHEPIELADGRVLSLVETERRALDASKAIPILRARYGQEAVDRAVDLSLSLGALEAEVNARRGPKEKLKTKNRDGVLDRILAEIDKAGGLEVRKTSNVTAKVPKKR